MKASNDLQKNADFCGIRASGQSGTQLIGNAVLLSGPIADGYHCRP
jgi:hypothetical protein